jgi:hypothetical protein
MGESIRIDAAMTTADFLALYVTAVYITAAAALHFI